MVPVHWIHLEIPSCCLPPPYTPRRGSPSVLSRLLNTSNISVDCLWGESPNELPLSHPCQLHVASSDGPTASLFPGLYHSHGIEPVAADGPNMLVPLLPSAARKLPLTGSQPRVRDGRASQLSSRHFSGDLPCQTTQWGCWTLSSAKLNPLTRPGRHMCRERCRSEAPPSLTRPVLLHLPPPTRFIDSPLLPPPYLKLWGEVIPPGSPPKILLMLPCSIYLREPPSVPCSNRHEGHFKPEVPIHTTPWYPGIYPCPLPHTPCTGAEISHTGPPPSWPS